jgi:hypothetical protein
LKLVIMEGHHSGGSNMRAITCFIMLPAICLAQDAVGNPAITFSKTHHDFGKLSGERKVTYRFKVTNTGQAYLNITKLIPSCGCTSSNVGKWSLAPGESTEIEVGFDPRGFRGAVRKSLQIVSNDPANPSALLTFEADVVQEIMPSTNVLFFVDMARSGSKKSEVKLQSGNGAPVQIKDVKTPGAPYLTATWKSRGNDALVEVVMDARKVPVGQMTGVDNLTVQTANPRFPLIPITVQWEIKPSVTATPERVAWVEKSGTALAKPVVLSQVNGKAFRIKGVKPSREDIIVEGVGPNAASSHNLNILFKAKNAGLYNEVVTVFLDDPDQPELKIRVSAVLR